ncbi:hexameric tyrosine-coordinated heme protein [Pseudohoeflea coraliihabitans]|uniref:Hexameric tyrosine-coordinated heme protein n=1 Tax=Pseudohoeflea coraliihabitans TaxID=2860393 RepID=A0ABS6WPM9_9HYPH|nr:hexameric tyrosine-coordinated heme protein [Pseudohoeflea sp. DP4N28-3]MBW3097035.1 hexameric tyrosine-coordinated heme protein [Pseudohoeflea sp. DP4N28-3]
MRTSGRWLEDLITPDAQSGYELAVKLARVAVKLTQPDSDIRTQLRSAYERDAAALIQVSHVVAVHFATIARANRYWTAA